MVIEGAKWMVVGDQPELGAAVPAGAVRPDVAQDVLMPVVHNLQFLILIRIVPVSCSMYPDSPMRI